MNKQNRPRTHLRIPPQSIESEKAVLGSIMLRKDAIHEVEDVLYTESFYVEKHKIIWEAMLDLSVKNEPIDMLSLSTKLAEKKQLERIGGNKYLAEIVNEVPSSSNVKHYAEIVQKKYVLRSLIEASDYISELAFEEGDDHIEDVLDSAEKRMFSVVSSPKNQKYVNLKDALPEAYERLERLHENKGMLRGLPTGFKDLDTMLSGLQKSDLIILAARPSMGKTTSPAYAPSSTKSQLLSSPSKCLPSSSWTACSPRSPESMPGTCEPAVFLQIENFPSCATPWTN